MQCQWQKPEKSVIDNFSLLVIGSNKDSLCAYFFNKNLCDIQLYAWLIIVVGIQVLDVGIIHNLKHGLEIQINIFTIVDT